MNDKVELKPNIENKEILNGIYAQINSFDSKAGILISVISILLAISLFLIDVLNNILKKYIFPFSIIYGLFLLLSIATISFSVLVVIPRKCPKKYKNIDKHRNVNYYIDLTNMTYNDFVDNKIEFYNNEETMFMQILVNAEICKRKHLFLKLAIFSMVPLAIFTIATVVFAMSFIYLSK